MPEDRRTNGLTATAWTPLGEIDPRVAQAVLAALAREGIAAYVSPATGTPGPYLDVRLPQRPVDRLHVDAARRVEAERVLALHEPPAAESGGPVDTDAIFAAIVAGWDAPEQTGPVARWPVNEDADPGGGAPAAPTDPAATAEPRALPTAPREHPVRDPRGTTGPADDDDDPVDRLLGDGKWAGLGEPDVDEHYEPPPPPPLPRPQKATFAALIAIVGGVLLLVWQALNSDPSGGKQVIAVAMILLGAGVLVARMRDRAGGGDDDDDDWDDGAVV